MKKNLTLIGIILLALIGFILLINKDDKVSSKIIKKYKNTKEEQFSVNLSDYTRFDWDSIVIYHLPKTKKEISDLAGFEYTDSIDLSSGIIFIKNNKKVYEEKFKITKYNDYKFIVYPTKQNGVRATRIEKKDAIFKGYKTTSKGRTRYSLYPVENNK